MPGSNASHFRIGISGWTYAPWRGVFYPMGLSQKNELKYASRQVNSIEINGTFYSLQRPTSYQKWHDETPADFVFAVKGPQYITHIRRLNNVQEPIANFLASGLFNLKDKLGPILWQFPPSMKFDAEKIEAFCRLLPHDTATALEMAKKHHTLTAERSSIEIDRSGPMRHAIEVRHESFATAQFIDILREYKVAVVFADTAGKWPYSEDIAADFVYLRLHGDEELYVSGYTAGALDHWAARIRDWAAGKESDDVKHWTEKKPTKTDHRDVFVYFDNDVKVKSPTDAMSLAHRLGPSAQGEAIHGEEPPPAPKLSKKALAERVRSHWPVETKGRNNAGKKPKVKND